MTIPLRSTTSVGSSFIDVGPWGSNGHSSDTSTKSLGPFARTALNEPSARTSTSRQASGTSCRTDVVYLKESLSKNCR